MADRRVLADGGPTFTYGDYLRWPEDERWELIDGVPFDMSPAPGTRHQLLLGELHRQVANALRGHPCRALLAPFDVRLPDHGEPDTEIRTVVQPDLVVLCDATRLGERGCRGAPDLAVEILSPSTSARDQVRKLALYERHGVREYWIVDTDARLVRVYGMGPDGRYGECSVRAASASLRSSAVSRLEVSLTELFASLD